MAHFFTFRTCISLLHLPRRCFHFRTNALKAIAPTRHCLVLCVVEKTALRKYPHYESRLLHQNTEEQQNETITRKGYAASLTLLGLLTGFTFFYLKYEMKKANTPVLEKDKGKIPIGGPWELTDQMGKRRFSSEFIGQWLLLYFGYTHCPDVCPEELDKLVEALNTLDKDETFPTVQPLFISIDPERDTPTAITKYLQEFSPRILGLTGSMEDIEKFTHTFRIYYSLGPKDDDEDYLVDHSIMIYLMGPDGVFLDYFDRSRTSQEIVDSVRREMLKQRHKPVDKAAT